VARNKGHRPIFAKFEQRTVGSKNGCRQACPKLPRECVKITLPLFSCDRGVGRPNPSYLHRHWSPLPLLAVPAAGGRGTSFLHSVVSVRACMLWCVVWMVDAAPRRINLSNSNPTPRVTFTAASRSWWQCVLIDLQISSLVFSFFRSSEICFSMCHWRTSLPTTVLGLSEVDAIERGGGYVVVPWIHRWDVVVLGPRLHRSKWHNDMCLTACSGPVHRLTKPH
jgi:hypothetical protein